MQIRKYRTKHFFKQNRSLQKFANIRRNIFPNSEAGFSFSKRLYTSVSLEYWNYFFFFSLIGTPSSIWKRSWQRIFATSKIQRDFYAFSWNSIDSLPARQNQLIWNIGIIFLFHRLLVNVRQKIPKDILEFWKLKNTCTCSHGIS